MLCQIDFRNPSFLCESGSLVSAGGCDLKISQYNGSIMDSGLATYPGILTFMMRLAVLSPISSASISAIVRWLAERYFGI